MSGLLELSEGFYIYQDVTDSISLLIITTTVVLLSIILFQVQYCVSSDDFEEVNYTLNRYQQQSINSPHQNQVMSPALVPKRSPVVDKVICKQTSEYKLMHELTRYCMMMLLYTDYFMELFYLPAQLMRVIMSYHLTNLSFYERRALGRTMWFEIINLLQGIFGNLSELMFILGGFWSLYLTICTYICISKSKKKLLCPYVHIIKFSFHVVSLLFATVMTMPFAISYYWSSVKKETIRSQYDAIQGITTASFYAVMLLVTILTRLVVIRRIRNLFHNPKNHFPKRARNLLLAKVAVYTVPFILCGIWLFCWRVGDVIIYFISTPKSDVHTMERVRYIFVGIHRMVFPIRGLFDVLLFLYFSKWFSQRLKHSFLQLDFFGIFTRSQEQRHLLSNKENEQREN